MMWGTLFTCNSLQRIIKSIARKHGFDLMATEGHLKLSNGSFTPLDIGKNGKYLVSVAHNLVENGDTIADPDILFTMYNGVWIPVEITQIPSYIFGRQLGGYRCVAKLEADGHTIQAYNERQMADVKSFTVPW